MSKVAWLEDRIDEVRALLVRQQDSVASSLSPFSRAALSSLEVHLSELQHDLHLAKAKRSRQLISLRLDGARLHDGTIPLHFLSRLSSLIERSMSYASYRIQYGKEATRRIPEEIRRTLDLRLADLAFGSTELVITGNTAPDLTGESLLENSLEILFQVLKADESDVAQEAASAGSMASRMLARMLQEIEGEGCSIDLEWTSSADRSYKWVATPAQVADAHRKLMQVTVHPSKSLTVEGVVSLLSSSGRIEVITDDGQKIPAKFARDLYDQVKILNLGRRGTFSFSVTRTTNQSMGQDLQDFALTGFRTDDGAEQVVLGE